MKFLNFSRIDGSATKIGCEFEGRCLDIGEVIKAGLINAPDLNSIEDALLWNDGLLGLEKLLKPFLDESNSNNGIPTLEWTEVRFLTPVFRPQKIIGIGLNYHDHAEEVGLPKPQEPLLFAMFANTVIGPEDEIIVPAISDQIDFEAEMGVVIGKKCRNVSTEESMDYVAGYTIVNDVSARDLQFSDNQWVRGKSIDTFAPMGPCLATTSSLANGDGLDISLRLNGHTMQQSNTSNLIFKVPELVSYVSQVLTLEPGDVISTGTPGGVGFSRTPPVFMQAGDIVEIDLEGVGTLRNKVAVE